MKPPVLSHGTILTIIFLCAATAVACLWMLTAPYMNWTVRVGSHPFGIVESPAGFHFLGGPRFLPFSIRVQIAHWCFYTERSALCGPVAFCGVAAFVTCLGHLFIRHFASRASTGR